MSLHLDRKKGQAIVIEIEQVKKGVIIFAYYDADTEQVRFLIKASKDVRKRIYFPRKEAIGKRMH